MYYCIPCARKINDYAREDICKIPLLTKDATSCSQEEKYALAEQERAQLLNTISYQLPLWLRAAGAKYLVHHSAAKAETVSQLLTVLGRKPSEKEIQEFLENADSGIEHLDEIAMRMGLFPSYVYEAREAIYGPQDGQQT